LTGYRLNFHKRSVDGSGKADAEYTGDETDFVWGVVFELDPAEKPDLDKAEGLGEGYSEKAIILANPKGKQCSASMYYANDIDSALKPYSWYLRFVVEGARQHGLPPDYISQLECVQTLDDADRDRDMQRRRIRC
jgi:hypothetical protein